MSQRMKYVMIKYSMPDIRLYCTELVIIYSEDYAVSLKKYIVFIN